MFQPAERIALAALDRRATPLEWLAVVDELHGDRGFWWLDTALTDDRLGRYSFAGSEPYLWLHARLDAIHGASFQGAGPGVGEVEIDVRRPVRPGLSRGFHRLESDPIDCARALLPRADSLVHSTRTSGGSGNPRWHEVAGLAAGLDLPFVGGAVGYFGYELAAATMPRVHFENDDAFALPDLSLAFVDRVLAYDHAAERLWVVGLGFAGGRSRRGGAARETAVGRSREHVDELAARVESTLAAGAARQRAAQAMARPPRGTGSEGERRDGSGSLAIESTADAAGYAKAVDTILQEIEAGNVYQANFSQRLAVDAPVDPWQLYGALRRHNPAPFGAFLRTRDAAILSSSPERFLRLDESRHVESRPIKGTRPRGDDALSDARLAAELAASEKDRAENLMIVDLVRNDLGRVCAPGSIGVPELMAIEAYATVFQMVSTVTGTLATGRDAFDLLRASFPPGSMTGAPKLASIGLLESLERVRRGVYSGALGYLDLRGGLDLSVVIRTVVWQHDRAHLHVGGGVVADSSPRGEYLESLDKAKAPLAALEEALGLTASPREPGREFQTESAGEAVDERAEDAGRA